MAAPDDGPVGAATPGILRKHTEGNGVNANGTPRLGRRLQFLEHDKPRAPPKVGLHPLGAAAMLLP